MMQKFLIFYTLCINCILGQSGSLIYEKANSSTVTIRTDNGSLGSGFFINPNTIVTNFHVIEGSNNATYFISNSNYEFKIKGYLGVDIENDLIILEVYQTNGSFLKTSKNNIQIGQKVFVIGSPKGLSGSFSEGVISGFRNFYGTDLVQMTAPISSGSSGGPVLNLAGELIGVSVCQIVDGQNLNFAIPIKYVSSLINERLSYSSPLSFLNTKIQIGQKAKGGIVFYVDDSGKHGLVCTEKILGNMTYDEAFKQCLNLDLEGYDDWYLPTIDELEIMNSIKEIMLKSWTQQNIAAWYWSSSKVKDIDNWMWMYNYHDVKQCNYAKAHKAAVRAVRRF